MNSPPQGRLLPVRLAQNATCPTAYVLTTLTMTLSYFPISVSVKQLKLFEIEFALHTKRYEDPRKVRVTVGGSLCTTWTTGLRSYDSTECRLVAVPKSTIEDMESVLAAEAPPGRCGTPAMQTTLSSTPFR